MHWLSLLKRLSNGQASTPVLALRRFDNICRCLKPKEDASVCTLLDPMARHISTLLNSIQSDGALNGLYTFSVVQQSSQFLNIFPFIEPSTRTELESALVHVIHFPDTATESLLHFVSTCSLEKYEQRKAIHNAIIKTLLDRIHGQVDPAAILAGREFLYIITRQQRRGTSHQIPSETLSSLIRVSLQTSHQFTPTIFHADALIQCCLTHREYIDAVIQFCSKYQQDIVSSISSFLLTAPSQQPVNIATRRIFENISQPVLSYDQRSKLYLIFEKIFAKLSLEDISFPVSFHTFHTLVAILHLLKHQPSLEGARKTARSLARRLLSRADVAERFAAISLVLFATCVESGDVPISSSHWKELLSRVLHPGRQCLIHINELTSFQACTRLLWSLMRGQLIFENAALSPEEFRNHLDVLALMVSSFHPDNIQSHYLQKFVSILVSHRIYHSELSRAVIQLIPKAFHHLKSPLRLQNWAILIHSTNMDTFEHYKRFMTILMEQSVPCRASEMLLTMATIIRARPIPRSFLRYATKVIQQDCDNGIQIRLNTVKMSDLNTVYSHYTHLFEVQPFNIYGSCSLLFAYLLSIISSKACQMFLTATISLLHEHFSILWALLEHSHPSLTKPIIPIQFLSVLFQLPDKRFPLLPSVKRLAFLCLVKSIPKFTKRETDLLCLFIHRVSQSHYQKRMGRHSEASSVLIQISVLTLQTHSALDQNTIQKLLIAVMARMRFVCFSPFVSLQSISEMVCQYQRELAELPSEFRIIFFAKNAALLPWSRGGKILEELSPV